MASRAGGRAASPSGPREKAKEDGTAGKAGATPEGGEGANYSTAMGAGSIVPLLLVIVCPLVAQLVAFISTDPRLKAPTVSAFLAFVQEQGAPGVFTAFFAATPGPRTWLFLLAFFGLARALLELPGKIENGPLTATGHLPVYVDNGVLHCVLFTAVFVGCSSVGLGLYDLGILYDEFASLVVALNTTGLLFCAFLTFKGLKYPSTKDCGSSGSWVIDYYWGTELYPKILGVDVKRFVNCRFSMTFWQLAGVSFLARSFARHGVLDHGLMFAALSQFLYLAKFFYWEIGYMRTIDIIVDRAGFYETWGCLVWVPTVYTLHSRICVSSPSQLSSAQALALFLAGMMGVVLNFWADIQRQRFREADGKINIWGKKPKFVEAAYTVWEDGQPKKKHSLLLASGFWGIARHSHYVFELIAAWSWGLLANPAVNGILVLFYPVFLTVLLFDRARRDDEKCSKKYGEFWQKYKDMVPYKIIPGVY